MPKTRRRNYPIKNRIKLLVLDIDGTLLNKQGTVSDEDKEALVRVLSFGIKVSLASGRSVTACLPRIAELGLSGFHTTFDGALVSDPKLHREVFAEPIPAAMVEQIIAYTHGNRIDIEL